jgi:alpha-beta hydrolase superfamily lysophospholipase
MKRALCLLLLLLTACGATAAPSRSAVPTLALPVTPTAVPATPIPTRPPPTDPATLPASPGLPPATPVPATPTPLPFNGRRITFTTEDGIRLGGTLYGGGPRAVILSNVGDGRQADWQSLIAPLTQRGLAVLTYDWRGLGESAGPANYLRCATDLQAAIGFLRAQGVRQIVLAGASLGGIASVKQATIAELAGLVVVGSPYTVAGLEISAQELGAIAVPKLFVTSKGDRVVAASEVVHLYDISREPKKLQVYEGDAHGTAILRTPDREHLIALILDLVATAFPGP